MRNAAPSKDSFVDACREVEQLFSQYRARSTEPEAVVRKIAAALQKHADKLTLHHSAASAAASPSTSVAECAALVPHLARAATVVIPRQACAPRVVAALGKLFIDYTEHTRTATKYGSREEKQLAAMGLASVSLAAATLDATPSSAAAAAKDGVPLAKATQCSLELGMTLFRDASGGVAGAPPRSGRGPWEPQVLMELLDASCLLRGRDLSFGRAQLSSFGLFPQKPKRDMEAMVMRCFESREILMRLNEFAAGSFTLIDALQCLRTMARTGAFIPDLATQCACVVAQQEAGVVAPGQSVGVLYSLGVLGHRTRAQKGIAARVDVPRLGSAALLAYLTGLAMLHQQPVNVTAVLDRTFAFALRTPKSADALKWDWYISAVHALHELNIHNHKLLLTTARRVRSEIVHFAPDDAMKLLFALSGDSVAAVPAELRSSWDSKVVGVINAVVARSARFQGTLSPADAAIMAQALRSVGVKEHVLLPTSSVPPAAPADADAAAYQNDPRRDAGAALRGLWAATGQARGPTSSPPPQRSHEDLIMELKAMPSEELAAFIALKDSKELQRQRRELVEVIAVKTFELSALDALAIMEHLDAQGVAANHFKSILHPLSAQVVALCGDLSVGELQRAVAIISKHQLPGTDVLAEAAFLHLHPPLHE